MPIGPNGTGLMALTDAVIHVASHPRQVLGQVAALIGGTGMLIGELMKKDDPQSPLKGEFAQGKRVAWSHPVAIQDVKAIGARTGAKVNDVLVAAMTGALRSYLSDRGVDVNHTTVRAMVPVDLRDPNDADQLGNAFGLVILELAISKSRPDQRLALTQKRMDTLKRSPEALAARAFLEVLGRVPKALEDFSNNLFGKKASLVMTNVVGSRTPLHLAGVPIDSMLAWAPHPGKQLGMAISILSYNGRATLTVISDSHLLPDPENIAEHFDHEFKTMLRTKPAVAAKAPAKKRVATKTTTRRQQPHG